MAQFMFSIILAALTAYQSESANTTVVTRLYRELLSYAKYEPAVRPTNDSDLPLVVECAFVPILHHVEIVNQEIKVRGRMVMSWVDDRLGWDPEDYEGIDRLQMKVAKIWRPDLTVYEGISTDSEESFQTETNVATISYTGEVQWDTMATSISFCLMDVTHFPHDKHKCFMTMTTLAYLKTEVHLNQNKAILGNYTYKDYEVHNAEWEMDFMENDPEKTDYVKCDYCLQNYSSISYIVSVKRVHPINAYITFLFPCFLLGCVSSCIAFFPRGSEEAPSFGLACCLALTVFLMALYNMLPGTAFCQLGLFMAFLLCVVALETIVAALFLLLCQRGLQRRGTQPMRDLAQFGYDSSGQTQPRPDGTPTASNSSYDPTDDDTVSLNPTQGANGIVQAICRFCCLRTCVVPRLVVFGFIKIFFFVYFLIVVS